MALNQFKHNISEPLQVNDIVVNSTATGSFFGNFTGSVNSSGVSTFTVISGVTTLGVSSAYINTFNDGPLAGSRNRIINGDMRVDQRNVGAAQSISAGAALTYTVDRWWAYSSTVAIQGQQTQFPGTFIQNRYVFSKFNQATSTTVFFGQRIESQNAFDLAGNVATVSLDMSASTSTTTITGVGWTAYYPNTQPDTFGSIASPTKTAFASGTININPSIQRYSVPLNVSIGATMGIELVFSLPAGISTTNPAVGAGATIGGGTWIIGNVQLEKGPIATPFERRSFSHEVILCQRYFEKTFDLSVAPAQNVGSFNGAITGTGAAANTAFGAQWWFKANKFASPSVVTYTPNAATATWSTNTTTPTLSGAVFGTSSIYLNGTTSVTAGNNYSVHAVAYSEIP
jgi:hypothetical protein